MIKSYEKTGKTEDEAIVAALADLGLERDDVSVEILERAKSGFLGIGSTPAVVRIQYEAPDEEKKKPVPVKKEEKTEAAYEKDLSPAGEDLEAKAHEFISGLLDRMGVRAKIEISEKENGDVLVKLSGDGMGAVIGRRGETLDAIQHLTNYAVNRGGEKRRHISVDAENYRAKREDSLVQLAEKMAAKVVKYKRSMALEPMNSYERHVIHTALQDCEGVSTSSIGTEPNRRVVVSYEKTKQQASDNKPGSREWS
ncbi:MAG: protein jag [Clostridia bacterium]|nr:protein jag [Clostridia bacterium]NCC68578.1 protein jag [Clostridia bacterium]